ncbi:MAG: hypothetical protein ACTSPD_12825 [Promethearchaeota archaeon]
MVQKKRTSYLILILFLLNIILIFGNTGINCKTDGVNSNNNREIEENVNLQADNPPILLWNKTWGGGDTDRGPYITYDDSGYIYQSGRTLSWGTNKQSLIIKYDLDGNIIWNKSWGGTNYYYADKVWLDSNKNVYFSTFYNTGGFIYDNVIVKMDPNGNEIWNKIWGGPDSETGNLVIDSKDNLYLGGLVTNNGWDGNIYIAKFDSDGNQLWNKTYANSTQLVWGARLYIDKYDNLYISSSVNGLGMYDNFLVKFDSDGNHIWNLTWGGDKEEYGGFINFDNNDNILMSGEHAFSGDFDGYLVKFDSDGKELWNVTWGEAINWESYRMTEIDGENNILITGHCYNSITDSNRIILRKYDTNGNEIWTTYFDGPKNDYGHSLLLIDGIYIFLSGYTESYSAGKEDALLLKYIIPIDWKTPIKSYITDIKEEIEYGINLSIFLISEMIAIWINDSLDLGLGILMDKIVKKLGIYTYSDIIDRDELLSYMKATGSAADQLEELINMFYELSLKDPKMGGYIIGVNLLASGIVKKFLTHLTYTNTNEIYQLMMNDQLIEQLFKIQSSLSYLDAVYNNFITWIDAQPDDMPSFDFTEILGILSTIKTGVIQGIVGERQSILTPDGSVFPSSAIVNLYNSFLKLHKAIEICAQSEQILDIIKISMGIASVTTSASGIGVPISTITGVIYSVAEVQSGISKTFRTGSIAGELSTTILSLYELKNLLSNFPSLLNKAFNFVEKQYSNPTKYSEMKIQVVNINSPGVPPIFGKVGTGSLTVKNTGSISGKLTVLVTIRAPDNTPIHRYYLSKELNPNEQHTFNTYYFGRESDYFGLKPYTLEFRFYMNGSYLGARIDTFYVGLTNTINQANNIIKETYNVLIDTNEKITKIIETAKDDVFTWITGGEVDSDVDLRLWNENYTTLLVGMNYTTKKFINLIGANYSGNASNPEYIIIPNPNGTNYTIEIVGVNLPHQENTTIMYMNIGKRDGILGIPNQLNSSNFFFSGKNGNITNYIPVMECGFQKNLTNLVINSTNLIYLGNKLIYNSGNINFNLTNGEIRLFLLNYSYNSSIIKGNYTGFIEIWNITSLIGAIPITVEMCNESELMDLNFPELPVINTSSPSYIISDEYKDVNIDVLITDDKTIDFAFLFYSLDLGNTWIKTKMTNLGGDLYSSTIPGQSKNTVVYYQIYAFDNNSLMRIDDNNGLFYRILFQEKSANTTDDDDDDDDDSSYEETSSNAIPYGNYYILSLSVMILFLILSFKKRQNK